MLSCVLSRFLHQTVCPWRDGVKFVARNIGCLSSTLSMWSALHIIRIGRAYNWWIPNQQLYVDLNNMAQINSFTANKKPCIGRGTWNSSAPSDALYRQVIRSRRRNPLPCTCHELWMCKFMIVCGLCFMIGKALAWGTFPQNALQDLATIFILSSLFWECLPPLRAIPFT